MTRRAIFGIICAVLLTALTTNISTAEPAASEPNFEKLSGQLKELQTAPTKISRAELLRIKNSMLSKVEVNKKDGQAAGLRLVSVRANSIFDQMGLGSGDLVLSVNGRKLTELEDLFSFGEGEYAMEIVLERDGKALTRRVEFIESPYPQTIDPAGPARPLEGKISAAELERARGDSARTQSQARGVPYFRNGKQIGIRLFALRTDSIFERMGIKNGDIILSINGTELTDKDKLNFFMLLVPDKKTNSIDLTLERNSEIVKIHLDAQFEKQ